MKLHSLKEDFTQSSASSLSLSCVWLCLWGYVCVTLYLVKPGLWIPIQHPVSGLISTSAPECFHTLSNTILALNKNKIYYRFCWWKSSMPRTFPAQIWSAKASPPLPLPPPPGEKLVEFQNLLNKNSTNEWLIGERQTKKGQFMAHCPNRDTLQKLIHDTTWKSEKSWTNSWSIVQ